MTNTGFAARSIALSWLGWRKNESQPSPSADRATLIRRLSLDLLGLPPAPEEVASFVNDRRPMPMRSWWSGCWHRLIMESVGTALARRRGLCRFERVFDADSDRPFAWRYRDYVIRAFDEDKPFDEFVQEQIAGDELAGYKPGDVSRPRT